MEVEEIRINIVSERTMIRGAVVFDHITRVHGKLEGEVTALPGSTLVLCETAVVEGNITADELIIDGFVQGDIHATKRVVLSSTGRVIGNIGTPSLEIAFGAAFEGRCKMEN